MFANFSIHERLTIQFEKNWQIENSYSKSKAIAELTVKLLEITENDKFSLCK